MNQSLTAVSPVDGRYASQTEKLNDFFSEFALIRYRLFVEVEYFIALCSLPLPQLKDVDHAIFPKLRAIISDFTPEEAQKVKDTEKVTNHDVKAVEYYLKEKMEGFGLGDKLEFVHFGLTSQDINNTAIPLSLKEYTDTHLLPELEQLVAQLKEKSAEWESISLLARTHGQPASPTRLGKEFEVFVRRLEIQIEHLKTIPQAAKFGGATGNMNAHYVAYPEYDWHTFAADFLSKKLGLFRSFPTTQIEHYDQLAAYFDALKRIHTILIDLCRDVWTYVSMDYFKQKIKKGEVGSSAMPHKVNPIDFENAEGNLGLANALCEHLSAKLPISRLQRDLTDSTVLRNVGMPLAYGAIALKSIRKGLNKLIVNEVAIRQDLENNWAVVAEAIQTILRREGYPKPYEALKALTRTHEAINERSIHAFIDELDLSDAIKTELRAITPFNYTGK